MTATSSSSTRFLDKTVTTSAGITHIDLKFSAAMAKGSGSIFVTDGAVQTVIDRVTGEPTLRVVGATFTKEVPLSQVTVSGSHVSFDAAGLALGKHYSIFMGAGTLQSASGPFAGWTVPGDLAFELDGAPPVLSASFSFDNDTLKAGQDIEVLVTLSQDVASLDAGAFSAQNAAVRSVTSTENPFIWKVVLTKDGSVADLDNVLSLDLSRVEVAPDVYGSGIATSPSYAVDTLVNPWISLAGPMWDSGVSREDNLIDSTTPYLQGELHGGLDDGDVIELFINGTKVDSTNIDVVRESTPWTWSYSPGDGEEGPYFDEGENTVTVHVKNGDHTSAAYSTTIFVDTVAPEIDNRPSETAPLPLTEDIVITFTETLYWANTESDMMAISVYCPEDETEREIWVDASAFIEGGDVLTLDPAELGIEAGKHYELRLPDYLTDYAGNSLADPIIGFHTGALDVTGPSATHVLVSGERIDNRFFLKANDTITFRVKFDEAIRQASDAVLWVDLSNGGRAEVDTIDGDEVTFTYTVEGPDTDIGNLTITDASMLIENIEDLAGNPLTGPHIVFNGLHEYMGFGYGYLPVGVTVDTEAPEAPAAPSLAAGSDSGTLGDRITNDRTPTLSGSAEARALISIYEGDVYLGGARADSAGHWEADVELELANGVRELRIVQTDRAGNDSSDTAYSLTIDDSAPTAPSGAPDLAPGSDSGAFDDDDITNERQPTFTGSGLPGNTGVALFADGAEIGRTVSDGSGHWSFTVPGAQALADGTYDITVRQFDPAGNMSGDSPALSITVDNIAPTSSSYQLNLTDRKFSLPFSEAIVFHPSGRFNLYKNNVEEGSYLGNNGGSWNVTADGDGDLSVLSFNISLSGLLRMQWNNGSVTDLAGNVAIVGSGSWEFTF